MPYSSFLSLGKGIKSTPDKLLRTWGTWLDVESAKLDEASKSSCFSLRTVKRYLSLRFTKSWTSPQFGKPQ